MSVHIDWDTNYTKVLWQYALLGNYLDNQLSIWFYRNELYFIAGQSIVSV